MNEIKIHPQTEEQAKENRALLSALLSDAEKIIDVASDVAFVADFFGMSKTDFLCLWYDITDLREKIEGVEPIRKMPPEKDVAENEGN